MTTDSLCERFRWSPDSEYRNQLTVQYEPIQPFVLLAMTRMLHNAILVDVGANIGFYTVVVGNEETVDEVYAFEPMPRAASAVRWNAKANHLGKPVVVRELALSDHCGQLQFAVRSPLAGDNGALQDSMLDPTDFAVESVHCERLDDVLPATGREIILKVDVEGHELCVLLGATRTLKENRGFLQIEMHESPTHAEKVALLSDLGWNLVTRIGPDHYFSNIHEYARGAGFSAGILEEALGMLIEESKNGPRASRRRLASGVYLQMSRHKADSLKRMLRR